MTTNPQIGDTKLTRWKRYLASLQKAGSFRENDPKPNDTIRVTLVKILRSQHGTKTGGI